MAELPDLDTTGIGFIRYWNAIDDGGAPDIDPSTVVSANSVTSFDEYDNGVQGKYITNVGAYNVDINSISVNFRVKTDGWIIAWLDDSEEFPNNGNGTGRNHHDVLTGIFDARTPNTFPNDRLEDVIRGLANNLDTPVNYSAGETGMYNFEYQDSTTISVVVENGSDYRSSYELQGGISYTANTDRDFHLTWGSTDSRSDYISDFQFGDTIFITNSNDNIFFGITDTLGNDIAPNSGVTYQHSGSGGGTSAYSYRTAMGHMVIFG